MWVPTVWEADLNWRTLLLNYENFALSYKRGAAARKKECVSMWKCEYRWPGGQLDNKKKKVRRRARRSEEPVSVRALSWGTCNDPPGGDDKQGGRRIEHIAQENASKHNETFKTRRVFRRAWAHTQGSLVIFGQNERERCQETQLFGAILTAHDCPRIILYMTPSSTNLVWELALFLFFAPLVKEQKLSMRGCSYL